MALQQPAFEVLYNNVDITTDVTRHLTRLTYRDKTQGGSDELEIQVEDVDALWRGAWYPAKGAALVARIGYRGGLITAGAFEIDEISLAGPPDTVTLKALAAGITEALRTKRSRAHEDITLRRIAEAIAADNALTVEGQIQNVRIGRVTQDNETDLSFLRRLAEEYGYLFSVRGSALVFTDLFEIEGAAVIRSIDRTEVTQHSLRDKTADTYAEVEIRYTNPDEKKTIDAAEAAAPGASADTLQLRGRVENKQQAELKAKAALHRANSRAQSGNITLPGDPLLCAGVNIELTGMGVVSGVYHIEESEHTFTAAQGYTTRLEIKKLAPIPPERWAARRPEYLRR